ncbi:hypothetical protein GGD81_001793 [Rhodobium orientis]|uniref:Uncharacterized protein n=1 Tax=Rhodobium orientis TaxID=34017 RepID=A0A327JW45_9HYPH|nr:hypothetical protein [Rhodobium orientis]MBB4302757.1 hypothetical protein [Rhodobium orientis]MBK5948538.1 hypothetical protein [Rhodobium orientis]RAI29805.1 hypothetical protein CH339_01960 [Rhodobium orientis]
MSGPLQMRLYSIAIGIIVFAGLAWVYAVPPQSMRADRDGRPHFQPQVMNPETGKGVPLGDLIDHFKGG